MVKAVEAVKLDEGLNLPESTLLEHTGDNGLTVGFRVQRLCVEVPKHGNQLWRQAFAHRVQSLPEPRREVE
jgi:hypothetical protein